MVPSCLFCLLACSFIIILSNLLRGIPFIYFKQFLLYSVFCPKLVLHLFLLQIMCLFYDLSKCILLFFSYISLLLLLFFLRLLP